MKRILALCLVAALLLCGCSTADVDGFFALMENRLGQEEITAGAKGQFGEPGASDVVRFSDMEYTHPDLEEIEQVIEESCGAALNGERISDVEDGIWDLYQMYDDFYTNYALAYIHYSADMTDSYWEGEYDHCAELCATVDAGLEELYYSLADSPFREELESDEYFGEGYFDAYEGESIYDETYLSLLEQEAALVSQYYSIASDAMAVEAYSEEYFSGYGSRMEEIFVELVALRQQIAEYAGYDSYPQFAYDYYYYRDYTPEQATDYMEQVQQELVALYVEAGDADVWDLGYEDCTEQQTYEYVRGFAREMGGWVEDAFDLMEAGELYDIIYSENKLGTSFEMYLDSYYVPYVFTSPQLITYDKLSFAHEFGHFCNDYVCGGGYSGIDVAEVFSQGMEYLSLCYGEDTEELEKFKMVDSLSTFVEQSAYAAFEHQVFDLKGGELTVENVRALYEKIGIGYGFDNWQWDTRDYVMIEHFFAEPMYMISYVVSNDVAMQIYQLEKEEPGAGLELYEENLGSADSYIVYFAESVGLESPFAPGRLEKIRQSMEEVLE